MQLGAKQHADMSLLDRASGSPGEEANGPGARVCWVHHILVELEQHRLQQTYDASCQTLCHSRHQPAQLPSLSIRFDMLNALSNSSLECLLLYQTVV